ncbi:MAG: SDR family oxidoreductase [Calditrichia bacterium]
MSARKVLVTGSSNGFGYLIVQSLLSKGHTVYATMRGAAGKNSAKAAELSSFAEGKSGAIHILDMDVTDDASVEQAVAKAVELGGIDVVVNNAGYGVAGYTEAVTTDQMKHIFDVNVFGVHRVIRAALPGMRAQGSGLFINISSVMGRVVLPFASPYTATKFALEGFSESLRYELAPIGVDVTIIEPGGFGTGFLAAMVAGTDEARLEGYGPLKEIPDQMWGGFEQALASDDAPDPQLIADAALELIETPAGQRPLRVVVDPMSGGEGPSAINGLTGEIQTGLMTNFGMADSLSVKG